MTSSSSSCGRARLLQLNGHLPSRFDSGQFTKPNEEPFVSLESPRSPLPFSPKSPIQNASWTTNLFVGVSSAAAVFFSFRPSRYVPVADSWPPLFPFLFRILSCAWLNFHMQQIDVCVLYPRTSSAAAIDDLGGCRHLLGPPHLL